MTLIRSIPFRLAALCAASAGLASAQEQPQPTVEARVEAVLADHAGGDVAKALARLDALVGAEGVDPAPIRASRYRLRMALGEREAALEDLRWLSEEAGAEWRAWAEARAGDAADDADPDRRVRDLIDRALRNSSPAPQQLRRLGSSVVPTLIDVLREMSDTHKTGQLVAALSQIESSEAVEWLSTRLRTAGDPVLGLQIAEAIDRAPNGMRAALAGAALASTDATIRRYGLAAWSGEYGEREQAVAREFPETAAEAVFRHDPRGERGLQQQVWDALDADGRHEFARTAAGPDVLDIDPELLPRLLQWPDVTLQTWNRLPRDVRRGAQDAAREALRGMRGKAAALSGARGTATTQSGSSPWEQLLEDVAEFGWSGLVDDLLPLVDHPDRNISARAFNAVYRLAPQVLLEHLRAADREVPDALWLEFGSRDDLDAMIGAFLDLSRSGVREPAEPLLERILQVATAADLPRLAAVHRRVMEQNVPPRFRDRWHRWLRQHAAATTATRLLELDARDGTVLSVAMDVATAQDIPAITAAVRAALAAAQPTEAEYLVDALQSLDAREALTALASEHLAVLDQLDDSDVDRVPLWRQRFADGVDAAELDAALQDPQVAADPGLVDAVLSAVVDRHGLEASRAIALADFIARVPPARVAVFADAAWSRITAGIDDESDARLAAVALGHFGADRDPAGIPRFAAALELRSEIVQLVAVEQLVRTFAPAAVPHLLAAMRSDYPAVAAEAEAALDRLDRYFRTERAWRDRFQDLEIPWPTTTRDR